MSRQSLGEAAVAEVLEHHGIKGMKWGIRRERGSDGTVGGGKPKQKVSKDAKKAAAAAEKAKKHGTKSLSNEEMQALVNRINLEQQLSQKTRQSSKIKKGEEKAKQILAVGATVNAAIAFAKSPAGQAIRRALMR